MYLIVKDQGNPVDSSVFVAQLLVTLVGGDWERNYRGCLAFSSTPMIARVSEI